MSEWGLTAPAILFLETYKPLAFLGAQLLWVTQPFLSIAFDAADLRDFSLIVEDRAGVEALVSRLEAKPEQPSPPQMHQRT